MSRRGSNVSNTNRILEDDGRAEEDRMLLAVFTRRRRPQSMSSDRAKRYPHFHGNNVEPSLKLGPLRFSAKIFAPIVSLAELECRQTRYVRSRSMFLDRPGTGFLRRKRMGLPIQMS